MLKIEVIGLRFMHSTVVLKRSTNKILGRDQVDLLRNDDITDRARYVSGLLHSINDTTQ